ncbi:MAG: hypothetical protein KJO22_11950 [Bacteroidia bacterium]|nr:hypothetical protein [Bacteroidia bacterium]
MNFIEQYKAALMTFLATGIVVFSLFSIHITKKSEFIAESYYDLTPEPEEKNEEFIEELKERIAATDKAFNEDQEFKEIMKNFKTVSSNDYERTMKSIEDSKSEDEDNNEQTTESYNESSTHSYGVKKTELESFNKLNETLKKRSSTEQAEAHSKFKSTLSYSLVGRTLLRFKTPRYLCEQGGKIVVTIAVNSSGNVTDAYINGASTSKNQCLTNQAINYAKTVQFDNSNTAEQLGSITFYFKGKG